MADATHAVIRGRVVAGTVSVSAQIGISTANPSPTHAVGFTVDTSADGTFAAAVTPDEWQVYATPYTTPATTSCDRQTVTAAAGQTVEVTIACTLAP